MRPKKLSPPPEPPKSLTIPSDEKVDVFGSLNVIERVMENALDPNQGVTPGQLQDLCSMFLTAMHLRKVTPEYWMEKQELPFKLTALASYVEAEADLMKVVGLGEQAVSTLKGAVELSLKEISTLRVKMLEELKLLRQCPGPGAKVH
jgi:hypothetical protein